MAAALTRRVFALAVESCESPALHNGTISHAPTYPSIGVKVERCALPTVRIRTVCPKMDGFSPELSLAAGIICKELLQIRVEQLNS